jgi:tyrosine-protein phosphatase YwqE
MFSFFKKKPKISVFETLGTDMHSHLIPGIDDGSPDMETSLAFLTTLQELGYQKVITTPHILSGLYNNTSAIIKEGLQKLQSSAAQQGLTIQIEAASEYFIDTHFESLLQNDDLLSFGPSKFELIEMSFVAPSPQLEKVIFQLQTKGYQPILAHPKRYNYWHHSPAVFSHLKELGCYFQVNLPSLVGYYGAPTKKLALNFIKSGWVEFFGTDLHHDRHLELLKKHQFDSDLTELLQKYPVRNLQL